MLQHLTELVNTQLRNVDKALLSFMASGETFDYTLLIHDTT